MLNLRILGIDLGELVKKWTGVSDIQSLLEKPKQLEEIKERIEEHRASLRETQEQIRKKYGDAVRFDYDIQIDSLIGGGKDVHIGGGEFFQRLDKLESEKRRAEPIKRAEVSKKEGVREPLVDVFVGEDYLYITAELPGIDEKDIKLDVTDDKVTISVDTPKRKYYSEINLPAKVSPSPVDQTYKNGVLEVKLKVNSTRFSSRAQP
jgi:HSP20 family molecular chaperone IbpA